MCAICHEEMEDGSPLLCGHMFHEACLHEWELAQENRFSCPCCRRPIAGSLEKILKTYTWLEETHFYLDRTLNFPYDGYSWKCVQRFMESLNEQAENDKANVDILETITLRFLIAAALCGENALDSFLKMTKVNINATCNSFDGHYTALHFLAKFGYYDGCKTLLNYNRDAPESHVNDKNRADVNMLDGNGDSSLILAVGNSYKDDKISENRANIVKLLVENGAEVNYQNGYGNTALHRAARFGEVGVVKVLVLNSSADRELLNNFGRTALDIVQIDIHQDCVEIGNIGYVLENGRSEVCCIAHIEHIVYLLKYGQLPPYGGIILERISQALCPCRRRSSNTGSLVSIS